MSDDDNDMVMDQINHKATSPVATNVAGGMAATNSFSSADPGARLRSLVERIERLEEEKKNISEDIRDIYLQAKADGYDAKILRKIISLRKKNADERREENHLLELYMSTLGMME